MSRGHSSSVAGHGWSTALMNIAEVMPRRAASRWHRAGMSSRGERVFDAVGTLLVMLLAAAWTWAMAFSDPADASAATVPVTASLSSSLTSAGAPTAAYLSDAIESATTAAAVDAAASARARGAASGADAVVRLDSAAVGQSGQLRAVIRPGPMPRVARIAAALGSAMKQITGFALITPRPRSDARNGRLGLYYIGNWPRVTGRSAKADYTPPSGFIEVTQQNADTRLSDHFKIRDFLTHDQQNVWPKYVVINLRLVDKLELVLAELKSRGVRTSGVKVMSGFRTPQYNRSGGDPRGRAELSRHMYGDASDIFLDSNGDGRMDDLNRDGRSNIGDARVILAAVARVERAHPSLIGGAGVYPGESGNGPFIHIDTRGYPARWVGTGGN